MIQLEACIFFASAVESKHNVKEPFSHDGRVNHIFKRPRLEKV